MGFRGESKKLTYLGTIQFVLKDVASLREREREEKVAAREEQTAVKGLKKV